MNTSPLACNMAVFTPAERESHIQNTLHLYQSVQDIRAAENGYGFLFPYTMDVIKLAEFISKEKMCCPFLEFTLKVEPNEKPISLTLTGPDGTQEFLREEFQEAFA
ncbi:MAG: hypothetical protein Kow0070_12390 [Anaerolineales bacterium]